MNSTKHFISFFATFLIWGMGSVIGSDKGHSPNSQSNIVDVAVKVLEDVTICYKDRNSVDLSIEFGNLGTDSIGSLQLGWVVGVNDSGGVLWAGDLVPNAYVKTNLATLILGHVGSYDVTLWVEHPSGDVNYTNDTVSVTIIVDPPFVFKELNDTIICPEESLPIALTDYSNSYNWSNGTSGVSSVINGSGDYFVTATNSSGCTSVDSISVSEFLAPLDVLPNDTVLCEGKIFLPSVSAEFESYTWASGDTGSVVNILSTGLYSLSVEDSNGCWFSDSIHVSYIPTPNPRTPAQINFCAGDTVELSAVGGFSSYTWSTGSLSSSITINQPGLYYVTVTGASGCYGFDTVNVSMSSLPVVSFSENTMCNNEPLIVDVGWFPEINWSNGDTTQSTFISSAGDYQITVTDINNCSVVDTIEVINENVSVSLGPDKILCEGDWHNIVLNGYDSYVWENGQTSNSHYLGEPGVYSVNVTKNGCSATDEIELIEVLNPEVDFEMYSTSTTVEFYNYSSEYVDLFWDFDDGNSSTIDEPIHTFGDFGVYEITLTVSNECDTVSLKKDIGVFPLAYSGHLDKSIFSVYPTFAHESVNLEFGESSTSSALFYIFSADGKKVFEDRISNIYPGKVYQLDVSRYSKGAYFVKLLDSTEEEMIGAHQFIKN